MLKLLAKIKFILDKALAFLVGTVMAALVLDVLLQVLVRLVPDVLKKFDNATCQSLVEFFQSHPCSWTEELATYLMVWVGLLGASLALSKKAHLGIDYFVSKLSAAQRCITEMFVMICVAAFSFLVMIIGGTHLVIEILSLGQTTPTLGIQTGYIYLVLPVSGFFLVLYSLEIFVEQLTAYRQLKNAGPATDSSVTE